jgi:succinate-acetate transporter protein
MKTKRFQILFLLLLVLFIVSSCAPGNERYDGDPAGFFHGLWHGFISLVTFIVSLFNDHVTIYEVSNSGKLYNLGFVLGCAIFYGGGIFGSSRKK